MPWGKSFTVAVEHAVWKRDDWVVVGTAKCVCVVVPSILSAALRPFPDSR